LIRAVNESFHKVVVSANAWSIVRGKASEESIKGKSACKLNPFSDAGDFHQVHEHKRAQHAERITMWSARVWAVEPLEFRVSFRQVCMNF